MNRSRFLTMIAILAAISICIGPVVAVYESTIPCIMYRNDLYRSGSSSSTAPNSNNTRLWSHVQYNSEGAIVVDGRVIFPSGSKMYALDETTGVELWQSINVANSLSTVAAYDSGKVYVGSTGGYMYCFNEGTGEKLWEYPVEGGAQAGIESSPAIYGGKVYFGTNGGHLYCLNATTGIYISRYLAGNAIRTAPAIAGDLLYFGCDDGKVYALNRSQTLFQLKWTFTVSGTSPRVRTTPTVSGNFLLFGSQTNDHAVYAINRITGSLLWKFSLSGQYATDNSIAVAEGLVYCVPYGGNKAYALYLNATVGMNYTENNPDIQLWSQTLGYYSREPIFADNKIFVTNGLNLFALNAQDGSIVWRYTFSSSSPTSVAVADNHLFVSQGQNIHCFGNPFPPLTYVFAVQAGTNNYTIQIVTNATIKDPLDTAGLMTLKKISYNLTGIDNTMGMSNVTIPNELLGGPYIITVDGGLPTYETSSTDGTHTFLYFTYAHSSHTVEITGETVIPEFQTFAYIAMLAILVPLALVVSRKKRIS